MFVVLAPFFVPVPLTLAVYFQESTYSSIAVRSAWFVASTAVSTSLIINPQWENLFLRYFVALYSSWFIVWSANTLFISKPSEYKRIQKRNPLAGSRDLDNYFWQPLPEAFSWARFFWALDLATNFRGIGWSHGANGGSLPPTLAYRLEKNDAYTVLQTHLKQPSYELQEHHLVWRLVRAYFWFDTYQRIIVPLCGNPSAQNGRTPLWGWCIQLIHCIPVVVKIIEIAGSCLALYSITDGFHASSSLLGVFLCSKVGGVGEMWMYPPLFGPVKTLSYLKIQDAFGKFWHNHFNQGLISVSRQVVVQSPHPSLTNLLRALVAFVLAGIIHAAASYAVLQETRSLDVVMLFWWLQPFGIAFQLIVSGAVSKHISAVPAQFANLAIGFTWFYWMPPLQFGDPAICQALEGMRVPWSLWEVLS